MFNILSYTGNANQNDSSQNGHHQENKPQQMLAKMPEKRSPYTLLVGMQVSAAAMEMSMVVPQETKTRTAI
jgi:hypothetical protein